MPVIFIHIDDQPRDSGLPLVPIPASVEIECETCGARYPWNFGLHPLVSPRVHDPGQVAPTTCPNGHHNDVRYRLGITFDVTLVPPAPPPPEEP